MKSPDFFIVGAQKAGTTAVHDWLIQQPDVCLPTIKETHFFSHNERYERGLDWYRAQFEKKCDQPGVVVGEVDPEYMFFPEAADRVRNLTANPCLVFLLRQPLERAYSHYLMSVRRGYEDLPFVDALLAEQERIARDETDHAINHQSYLSRGMYSTQIERIRTQMPAARCLFIKFDDLISSSRGNEAYTSICEFVGVRSSPAIADRSTKSNPAAVPRSLFLRDFLWRGGRLRKALGSFIPSKDIRLKIGLWLDHLNQRPISEAKDRTKYAVPASIADTLHREILETERITGLDCTDWRDRLASSVQDCPPLKAIAQS
jgi:hypothetical protein